MRGYEAARESLPPSDSLRRSIAMNAAAFAEAAGNADQALRVYGDAAQLAEAVADLPALGQALDRLFALHRARGDADAAVPPGERSLAMWRARREPMNDVVLTFMNNLGQMYYRAGRLELAASLIEEVVEEQQRLVGGDTSQLAMALLNLGTVRRDQGDYLSAESHMRRALDIRRRLFPAGDPAIVSSLRELAVLYDSQGDTRKAIPFEEEILAIARRAESNDFELPRALNNVASWYYRIGEVAKSRPLYQEALAIAERIHGKQHRDTLVAMGNLANVLRRMEDFEAAERLLREVLAIRRSVLGERHEEVAIVIDDLTDLFRDKRSVRDLEGAYRDLFAMILRHFEDHDMTTPELLQSLRKIEREHAALVPNRSRSLATAEGERHQARSRHPLALAKLLFYGEEPALAAPVFAGVRENAADQTDVWSRATAGLATSLAVTDLARAAAVCDEYIARVHAGWQPPGRDYAAVLGTKSYVEEQTNGPAAAIASMGESAAQLGLLPSGGGVFYPDALVRLSELHRAAGDLEAAANFARRVVEQPPETIQAVTRARARAVLAHVARRDGRIVEAESLYRVAMKSLVGYEPSAWRTALLLQDFAEMYVEVNHAARAVPLFAHAARIAAALFGTRSRAHGEMLALLAEAKLTAGPLHEAQTLFTEIADMAAEVNAPELRVRALSGSGALYTRIGAADAAEFTLTSALTIMAARGVSPVARAGVETNLALTEARLKKYDVALARIDRVIATLRGAGERRADLSNAVSAKMWMLARMERWSEASLAARDRSDMLEQSLQRALTIASTRARDRLAADLYAQLDVVLSITMRDCTPAAIVDAFERTLRWKGVALTWNASQVQALARTSAVDVSSLRRDLIKVRRQIIERLISGSAEAASAELQELQLREEALDREIARQLSSPRRAVPPAAPAVTAQAVAAALPAGGALIEYVRYESVDFQLGGRADHLSLGQHRYAAFVVRAGAEPVLVDVGDADAIDRAVGRFRSAIIGEADPSGTPPLGPWVGDGAPQQQPAETPALADVSDWVAVGADLRRATFDPLQDAIGPCTRLLIAQHGELTRLPFAALPREHEFLIDRYELVSLDTGRDLLRGQRDAATPGEPLVIADPDFDLALERVPPAARTRPFEPLPGTREEGEAVASILHVAPVMGPEALESRVRSTKSPRILHVATHGFFLADDRRPLPSNLVEKISMLEVPGFGRYVLQMFPKERASADGPRVDRLTRIGRLADPLLRSGVALAGSNTWVSHGTLPDGEDGLLTAAEIALLDFTATDLAVLSACETGLGEVRRGEGIYGLRRAFAIAGARTLVMSLWKIPDAQTRDLMIEFYRRATAGELFPQALRSAQLHVRGMTADPIAWAGIVCIGQPSTMSEASPV